jgi:AraC-like DNA-binding protein
MTGQSRTIQNGSTIELAVGDVALVDAARPVTYVTEAGSGQWWRSLQLPRRSLVSHLGFEPRCPSLQSGTAAARSLRQLLHDGIEDEQSVSVSTAYMRLAVYDLLGALFAPSDRDDASLHTDKLFAHIRGIIKEKFADPTFGPCEVAAEAGISLRYLQKLFTERGTTCSHFIKCVRLDHASRLLARRSSLNTGQPISEIAYASGFGDYTNFIRKFRRRFGHTPSAHSGS